MGNSRLVRSILEGMRRWARLHPRRLLLAPRVELGVGRAGLEGGGGDVLVRGMVCALCAARTRTALASVPSVEAVEVDLEAGVARLRLTPGTRLDGALEAALQRAVDGVVVGLGARRLIEHLVLTISGRAGGGGVR